LYLLSIHFSVNTWKRGRRKQAFSGQFFPFLQTHCKYSLKCHSKS